MKKTVLFIATSQDNFISDVGWLPYPKDDAELEIVGYKSLMSHIDTILMESRIYKQILTFGDWGYPDKHTYVFTSQALAANQPYISIAQDSPLEFMSKFKNCKSDKDIWILRGAELAKSFAEQDLIDEVILTIFPKVLGTGIPLGLSNDQFDRVHTGTRDYDLTVDTSNASVFDVAKERITFIKNNPDPTGFNNMRGTLI